MNKFRSSRTHKGEIIPYRIEIIKLDGARADIVEHIKANGFLVLETSSGVVDFSIKLNSPQADSINLLQIGQMNQPFNRLYLTNTAQAGETITIFFGLDVASFVDVKLITAGLSDIETDIEATNTALGTIETDIETINTNLGTLEGKVDTLIANNPQRSDSAPTVYNVTMTNLDTQYSQALPANTVKFTIKTRDLTAFRLAYVTGKVAIPTAPFITVNANMIWAEDNVDLSSITLYFASDENGKVIEIMAWTL